MIFAFLKKDWQAIFICMLIAFCIFSVNECHKNAISNDLHAQNQNNLQKTDTLIYINKLNQKVAELNDLQMSKNDLETSLNNRIIELNKQRDADGIKMRKLGSMSSGYTNTTDTGNVTLKPLIQYRDTTVYVMQGIRTGTWHNRWLTCDFRLIGDSSLSFRYNEKDTATVFHVWYKEGNWSPANIPPWNWRPKHWKVIAQMSDTNSTIYFQTIDKNNKAK